MLPSSNTMSSPSVRAPGKLRRISARRVTSTSASPPPPTRFDVGLGDRGTALLGLLVHGGEEALDRFEHRFGPRGHEEVEGVMGPASSA